jgi:hypothetical protein
MMKDEASTKLLDQSEWAKKAKMAVASLVLFGASALSFQVPSSFAAIHSNPMNRSVVFLSFKLNQTDLYWNSKKL